MPTVVVSGRVDEDVKLRADAIIRSEGSSVARVISDVWQNIVDTGQLPESPTLAREQAERRAAFSSFMDWFEGLPAQNGAYAHLMDEEILEGRVDDYAQAAPGHQHPA